MFHHICLIDMSQGRRLEVIQKCETAPRQTGRHIAKIQLVLATIAKHSPKLKRDRCADGSHSRTVSLRLLPL